MVLSAVETTRASSATISDATEVSASSHACAAVMPLCDLVMCVVSLLPGELVVLVVETPQRARRGRPAPFRLRWCHYLCVRQRTWRREGRAVSEGLLSRARAGDLDAFGELVEPHRRELQVHCYRILGSVPDAEDMVQETLLAAWRGLEEFEGRSSVRAWLYRIATNRALDALRANRRRPEDLRRMTNAPEPTRRTDPIWLEPYPDVLLEGIPDEAPGPEARYETKEAVALAFIAGLQHLPPRQRAVLVLRDVLGFHAAEAAEMLEVSAASVNSLLRRA